MKLMTVIAVVGCLFLAGCSQESPPNSGTVVSKNHQPEKKWVQIILIPYITPLGKTSMTSIVPIPMFYRRPEHWVLVIQDTVEFEGERRQRQRELFVSRETYERTAVGDTYTVQATDKYELPVEKRRASNEEKLAYGVQPADSR